MKKIGTSRFSQWFSTTNIQDNVDDADTITNPNKGTNIPFSHKICYILVHNL